MSVRFIELPGHERLKNGGATHVAIVKFSDAAAIAGASTANTAVAVPLFTHKAGTKAECLGHHLPIPFKNSADAAHNTTTVTVGDAGDVDRLLVSQELNENGTYIVYGPAAAGPSTQPFMAATDTVINATIGSMSAKKISDLTHGEARFFFRLSNLKAISDGIPTG